MAESRLRERNGAWIFFSGGRMDIEQLTKAVHDLVDAKGWYAEDSMKPQTPRNLAISLVLEAAEVLELFQWSDRTPAPDVLSTELADVMLYLLQLASESDIDLEQAVLDKIRQNYDRTW